MLEWPDQTPVAFRR